MDDEMIREGLAIGALRRNADGSIEVTELGEKVLGEAATRRWAGPGEQLRLKDDARVLREGSAPPPEKKRRWFRRS